jgi:hypothetical protein
MVTVRPYETLSGKSFDKCTQKFIEINAIGIS